jgi:hypothetical protein
MRKIAGILGGAFLGLAIANACYFTLDKLAWWLGNMFIGVVVKRDPALPSQSPDN